MLLLFYWSLVGIFLSEYVQLISDRGSFIESIFGRSVCDNCKKVIPWYALIPFVGAAVTGGACVHCQKKVSRKYFWFEVLFSAGWVASFYFLQHSVMLTFSTVSIFLLFYCATALLMYEDLKNFSVPVSWLIVWCGTVLAVWYQLNFRQVYFLEAGLMLLVIVLSLVFMTIIKKLPLKSITELFGAADSIALVFVCLLFGFQVTTAILLGSIVLSVVYLIASKRFAKDTKIPLLTMLLPWIIAAVIVL